MPPAQMGLECALIEEADAGVASHHASAAHLAQNQFKAR
jgi:hypothetical protein